MQAAWVCRTPVSFAAKSTSNSVSLHRCLHATRTANSGHNRWSKIKHDKGKADAKTNADRSRFAQEIVTSVKLYGAETTSNPRLGNVIADAKRAGFPKASIEAAIARGLGRSANGKPLETLSVEAIMPGNVGIIIECETDTRLGHQASIVSAIKKCGGTTSPSSFLFARRGRVVFGLGNKTFDDIFEQAIEASAFDVSVEDGRVTVLTEPAETRRVAEALSESLGLDQNDLDTEIIWMANHDTESPLADSSAASQLSKLLDMVDDLDIHLQGVYANVAQGVLSEGMWSELRARITS